MSAPTLPFFLHSLTFKEDHRCFKQGDKIDFLPGVNLLVGEQGSGKSSLLALIQKYDCDVLNWDASCVETRHFDFEKDNLRTRTSMSNNHDVFHLQLATLWKSHGETANAILKVLYQVKNIAVLMDEPDQALSIRSCHALVESFKVAVSNGCQIIACVHNPIVISGFEEVISLEHRKIMSSKEFIQSHGGM